MSEVLNVVEYPNEGFAIIEDTVGKFIATKDSPEMIPLPDKKYDPKTLQQWFGRKTPCALLQSRDAMLT